MPRILVLFQSRGGTPQVRGSKSIRRTFLPSRVALVETPGEDPEDASYVNIGQNATASWQSFPVSRVTCCCSAAFWAWAAVADRLVSCRHSNLEGWVAAALLDTVTGIQRVFIKTGSPGWTLYELHTQMLQVCDSFTCPYCGHQSSISINCEAGSFLLLH